ncbi:MAG: IS256 family transposase [Gammaproteobacteria bacterium]|nr:IS256 family transposase [Gammaproteobacteria bacterium]
MEQDSTKALGKVIRIDEGEVRGHPAKMVRGTVEETLNALLDDEADRMCRAQRYERSPDRIDTRAGHYSRKLHTQAGEVELKVPKLRRQTFETAVIERWRNQAIEGECAYVYLDGLALKRSWGGEIRSVSVLAAIGVDAQGRRRVLGVAEGCKEDKAGWLGFLKRLRKRGLSGVRLIVSDACLGLAEAAAEVFPDAGWQRCVVHFHRNVFSHVPRRKARQAAAMLKAIHAQESRSAALVKARDVIGKLKAMKLAAAAELVENAIEETLAYCSFPSQHWIKLKTNNPMERLLREARRRTKVVGAFPDGQSALMLVAARLRHVSATQWGLRKYMNVGLLAEMDKEADCAAA